jgi:hypothetical protein
MATEVQTQDLILTAFPSDDIALIEGGSADGMLFMKREFKTIEKQSIKGNNVNSILNKIRELNLRFSFKLPITV